MELIINKFDSVLELSIVGRVDTVTSVDFEENLPEILEGNSTTIIVNCEEMSYISSTGLRVFLKLQKGAIASQKSVVIKNLSNQLKEVFNITGFTQLFAFE